jgi:hypothetical protein
MEKNKVAKYLKYAIGEIILVVIGILIALGVNNSNQERINANREIKIIQELKEEFSAAAYELKDDLIARDRYLKICKTLKDYHIYGKPLNISQDSIKAFLGGVLSVRYYSSAHPILDDLSSSGGLELIKSSAIRHALARYLEERNRYSVVESREADFTYNQVTPFFSTILDLSKVDENLMPVSELVEKIQEMKTNNTYGSQLQTRITRVTVASNYGERVDKAIKNVLVELDNELSRRL